MATDSDRGDPGVRAMARAARRRARKARWRIVAVATLLLGAAAGLVTAGPLTGRDGGWVGAIVLAFGLTGLAGAVWPQEWSPAERLHRELDAIWRELRGDADVEAPYSRFVARASATDTAVELSLIELAPGIHRRAGAPSPYRSRVVERLDPDDVMAAAAAMERLRDEARTRETQGRRRHEAWLAGRQEAAHRAALRRP